MATQTNVVIYNPTTRQHEPIAEGDTLDSSILPPSNGGSARKLWVGKADYNAIYIAQGIDATPYLVIGEKYLAWKNVATDDFSNVGQGADDSSIFIATGTTPAVWTNSIVYHVVEDASITEYYNTIGFTISAELKIVAGDPIVIFIASSPYWLNPLAIYNNASVFPIDDTKAEIYAATTKVVLEMI